MAALSYRVPVFPSLINVWHAPATFVDPVSVILPAQLTPGRRVQRSFATEVGGAEVPAMIQLLLPRGADIRDDKAPLGADLVECPANSGRFYAVRFVDDVGLGFANEHRFAIVEGISTWPLPYPTGRTQTGITAIPLLSGGSNGVPVALTFLAPVFFQVGTLLVIVADYNATGTGITCQIGTTTQAPDVASPVAAAGGNTVSTYIFAFNIGTGAFAGTIFETGGVGTFQWQTVLLVGLSPGALDTSAAIVGAAAPFIPGGLGQAVPLEGYVGQFAQLTSAGPFTFGAGFASTGLDVTDVIGGVNCTLSVGTLVVNNLGVYPTSMPLSLPAAWAGINSSFG